MLLIVPRVPFFRYQNYLLENDRSRREWNLERNGVDEIHPPRRRLSEQHTRLLILRQNYSLQNAFSNKAIETLTELVH